MNTLTTHFTISEHLLDQACNATYQCAPENSECNEDDGICICSNDFYDIKGDKTSCQGNFLNDRQGMLRRLW